MFLGGTEGDFIDICVVRGMLCIVSEGVFTLGHIWSRCQSQLVLFEARGLLLLLLLLLPNTTKIGGIAEDCLLSVSFCRRTK